MNPYPIVLEPILKEKVWGGRRLAELGKALPEDALVGESWELADLGATSADGGGGESAHSRVANGEMLGLTIREAITAMGANLVGDLELTGDGGFPLLVKYLDARENLSVQVHPSPAYAGAHPEAHLKTETWRVVRAEPGSLIYKGLRPGVTRDTFAGAIRDGSVVDLLEGVPARAGDVHHLPSGTCHALGAGVVVAEVQTPSDTTFRVFDWGRTGRALHVEQALECIDFETPAPTPTVRGNGGDACDLVATPHYSLWEIRGRGGERREIELGGAMPRVWMVLEGALTLGSDRDDAVACAAGTTVVLPASLEHAVVSFAQDTVVLEVRFPSGGQDDGGSPGAGGSI